MEKKITLEVFKMVFGKSLDEKYDNALKHGCDGTVLLEFSKLNQNYLTLSISDSEFESLDDIQKQGGIRQKQSYVLNFLVYRWEYSPQKNLGRVFVYLQEV
mgnify:CR=1 FL=1